MRHNWCKDAFNRKVVIPLLEKTAATNANFMIGNAKRTAEVEGRPVTVEITPEVREGNFIYRYSDRKTAIVKNTRVKEVQKTISEFSKIPDLAQKINWEECFKYSLASLGVENTSKFLLKENEIKPQNTVKEGKKDEVQTP